MKENFSKFSVRERKIIFGRGIQLGSGGKKKRKEKLFDLCK